MAVILITHGIPMDGFAALKNHTLIAPAPLRAFTDEELCAHIVDADAVVAGGRLSADVIRCAKKLKIIANYGAGHDAVDIAQAAAQGIPVTNIPDEVTDSTAELAIGLMLAVSRRIGEMNLRARNEAPEGLFGMGRYMGRCLAGQTLGIIGMGRIGKKTALLAKALGMRVLGYSRHGANREVCEPVSLDELLERADIVSIHCPSTPETRGMMNAAAFAKMKPGAMLINTARGAIVDTDALCDALEAGRLCGSGLDVFPDEPHIPARLLAMDNVVVTPHVGTNAEQTRNRMAAACSGQILDALAGKRPQSIVNGV